jgi:hypothetical protein
MSRSRREPSRSPTPTLVEVRTLVPKQTHAILAVAAKEVGIPVSVLVNRIIAVACQELLREGASHEQQHMDTPVDYVQSGIDSAGPTAVAEAPGSDNQGESPTFRADLL